MSFIRNRLIGVGVFLVLMTLVRAQLDMDGDSVDPTEPQSDFTLMVKLYGVSAVYFVMTCIFCLGFGFSVTRCRRPAWYQNYLDRKLGEQLPLDPLHNTKHYDSCAKK